MFIQKDIFFCNLDYKKIKIILLFFLICFNLLYILIFYPFIWFSNKIFPNFSKQKSFYFCDLEYKNINFFVLIINFCIFLSLSIIIEAYKEFYKKFNYMVFDMYKEINFSFKDLEYKKISFFILIFYFFIVLILSFLISPYKLYKKKYNLMFSGVLKNKDLSFNNLNYQHFNFFILFCLIINVIYLYTILRIKKLIKTYTIKNFIEHNKENFYYPEKENYLKLLINYLYLYFIHFNNTILVLKKCLLYISILFMLLFIYIEPLFHTMIYTLSQVIIFISF